MKNNSETLVQGNKVVYKRILPAPVDLAFAAWSSKEHLAEWWGPDGFTLTTISFDFSPGGYWDFIMHGPDGHDYKNKILFTEIQRSRLICYKHLGDGEGAGDVHFEARIRFVETEEGTELTMEQIFPSPAELERVEKKYGAIEGGKQHLANLEKFLVKNKKR